MTLSMRLATYSMQKSSLLLALLFTTAASVGQELNCKVVINDQQVASSDRSVFKDMERAFANFMNIDSRLLPRLSQLYMQKQSFEIHKKKL